MKAVNLVPLEQRRGSAGSRSDLGVLVLLGGLGVAVILVAVLAVLGKQVRDRQVEVAALEAQAAQAEGRAAELARYKQLAKDTGGRVQRVRQVAAGRVDWASALTELSSFLGDQVRFSSVRATSSPAATVDGTTNPLRGALGVPALEIEGCVRDHAAVARLVARLRAMDGARRVTLAKSDAAGGADGSTAGASGASAADCTGFAKAPATFGVVVFLKPPAPAALSAAGAGGATPTSTATPSTEAAP